MLVYSTHESDDDQSAIEGHLLRFGAAAGAAYLVKANERDRLDGLFVRDAAVPRLVLPSTAETVFGHGVYEVYVNAVNGGRVPIGLGEVAGGPAAGGYVRYEVPGAETPAAR